MVKDRDFSYPLVFDALVRGSPSDYCLPVWFGETGMVGLPDKSDDMFTRFDRMYECDRRTDRHTHTYIQT